MSVQVLKEEKNLLDEFTFYEKGERENFSHMSSAGERLKPWLSYLFLSPYMTRNMTHP